MHHPRSTWATLLSVDPVWPMLICRVIMALQVHAFIGSQLNMLLPVAMPADNVRLYPCQLLTFDTEFR